MSYDVVHEPGFQLHASQQDVIVTVSSAMLGLATVAVALRFFSRKITHVSILWDDWLILIAWLFTVVSAAINIYGAINDHFGTHLLATASNGSLHSFLRGLYAFQITYTLAVGIAKLSIIALYWRIFPSRTLKIPLMITGGATVCWITAVTLVAIFSCTPVRGFWRFELTTAKCINSQAYFIGSAAGNILTDIVLLVLPLYMVSRLQINFSQKIAVSAIFLLGLFGTICSCLRLYELLGFFSVGLKRDPTWDTVGSGLWSTIETCVVVVCACLPSMRPLLRLMLKGKLRSTRRSGPRGIVAHSYGGSAYGPHSSTNRRSGRFSMGFARPSKPPSSVRIEENELQYTRTNTISSVSAGLVPGAQGFAGADDERGQDRLPSRGGEVWVTSNVKVTHSLRRMEPVYAGVGRGLTTNQVEAWRVDDRTRGGGGLEMQSTMERGEQSWMDLKGNGSSSEELGDRAQRGRGPGG